MTFSLVKREGQRCPNLTLSILFNQLYHTAISEDQQTTAQRKNILAGYKAVLFNCDLSSDVIPCLSTPTDESSTDCQQQPNYDLRLKVHF